MKNLKLLGTEGNFKLISTSMKDKMFGKTVNVFSTRKKCLFEFYNIKVFHNYKNNMYLKSLEA